MQGEECNESPECGRNAELEAQHAGLAKGSVAHFWASRIGSLRNKGEANTRPAVWTFGSNSRLIEEFILICCKPHQLSALGAATDLRCHDVPRTLRVIFKALSGR